MLTSIYIYIGGTEQNGAEVQHYLVPCVGEDEICMIQRIRRVPIWGFYFLTYPVATTPPFSYINKTTTEGDIVSVESKGTSSWLCLHTECAHAAVRNVTSNEAKVFENISDVPIHVVLRPHTTNLGNGTGNQGIASRLVEWEHPVPMGFEEVVDGPNLREGSAQCAATMILLLSQESGIHWRWWPSFRCFLCSRLWVQLVRLNSPTGEQPYLILSKPEDSSASGDAFRI